MFKGMRDRTDGRGRGPWLVAAMACALGVPALGATGPAASSAAHADLSLLPLNFEANQGQVPDRDVQYLAHGKSYGIGLTRHGAVLALGGDKQGASSDVVGLELVGSAATRNPQAEQALPGKVNYFIGDDPTQWLTGISTYGQVRYQGVYPGVDLVYYGHQGHLEYDFDVAPGADANRIAVRFRGADKLQLSADGNLSIETRGGEIAFLRPVAYQWNGKRRVPVTAQYRVAGKTVHFALGAYDHRKALVVDPVLSYFSYLGGSNADYVGIGQAAYDDDQTTVLTTQGAAVDSAGDLYVVGNTVTTPAGVPNFPTAGTGPVPPVTKVSSNYGLPYVFLSKISPDGSTLLYSSYFGGNYYDYGNAIALDTTGIYLTGTTSSTNFPVTTGAFQTIGCPNLNNQQQVITNGCNGTQGAFVMKISLDGTHLIYSTYLSGTSSDTTGTSIAVDAAGNAYVGGATYPSQTIPTGIPYTTASIAFPTTANALQSPVPYPENAPGFAQFGYVSVFNPTGTALLYSSLVGDTQKNPNNLSSNSFTTGDTAVTSVTVDGSGNFYVGGYTKAINFPTTTGAYQKSAGPVSTGSAMLIANFRGFVLKFNSLSSNTPATEVYGTYLGSETDPNGNGVQVSGIAVDPSGDVFVTGATAQQDYPTTTGAFQVGCNVQDPTYGLCFSSFITKLNPGGSAVLASTYYGDATGNDEVYYPGPLVLDASGSVYVTGFGAPVQVNSVSAATANGQSPYVAKFNANLSSLLFATVLNTGGVQVGDGSSDTGAGLAVDSSGNIYLAGSTNTNGGTSAATSGAFQKSFGGGWDAWVAKISSVLASTTTSLTATPTSAVAGTAIGFTAVVKPTSGSAVPTGSVSFQSGGTTLGTGTLNGTGQASFSTSSLAVGTYSITAVYSGDGGDSASTSSAVSVTVTAPIVATTTTLAAAPTTASQGTAVALTATVTPASGSTAPTGTVSFLEGSTTLGTATLSGGKATFSTSSLAVGAQVITAKYEGSAADSASTSSAVTVTITADVPAAPTGLAATAGNAQVALSWSASSGATSYVVYEGTSSGGEAKTPVLTGVTGTSTTITGLTNGTAYYFTVAAVNAGGTSAPSAQASATPTAPVSSGGHSGGGALGPDALAALAALAVLRYASLRRRGALG